MNAVLLFVIFLLMKTIISRVSLKSIPCGRSRATIGGNSSVATCGNRRVTIGGNATVSRKQIVTAFVKDKGLQLMSHAHINKCFLIASFVIVTFCLG